VKILERRRVEPGGFGDLARYEERVVALGAKETAPEGAEVVPDDTPVYDWRNTGRMGGLGPGKGS